MMIATDIDSNQKGGQGRLKDTAASVENSKIENFQIQA
jgi:hypothetical protein